MQENDHFREKEDAQETLLAAWRQNGERWKGIARAILKNKEDAEDVLQESIRRVLHRDLLLMSNEQMCRYMGRTVNNTALEFYKRRQREKQQYSPVQESIVATFAPDRYDLERPDLVMVAEESYDDKERRLRLLRQGLQKLPVRQYEAIRLVLLGGNSPTYRDMEAASGIPRATLRHRYLKGLQTLRRYVERADKRAAD